MEYNELLNLISNNLFPIMAFLLLYKKLLEEQKAHKDETDSLTQAIHNNTLVMQRLYDRLEATLGEDLN